MIFDKLMWGSNGVNGTEPLKVSPLTDLDSSHLNNILACCSWHLPSHYKQAIRQILQSRGVTPIVNITDDESALIYDAYITKRDAFLRDGVQ